MTFRDRDDAGRQLAEALAGYAETKPVILALPRGGVPVAAVVAAALGAPLDLLLVRKIGTPRQPELAMGAVVDGGEPITVRNREVIELAGVTPEAFKAARDRELAEIERRRERYLAGREPTAVAGRVVIVIDDGIATGATVRAGLQSLRRRKPKAIVLAVPVAPPSTLEALRREADDIVCLEAHEPFGAIGVFYADFRQLRDEEVVELLREADAKHTPGSTARPA
jgi:putative phosphoribosyl transferase